ncbi:hypothetical protein [Flavisolibacter tropicus]|uniref:Nucleotide-diphospho-sugar transferase domain-containing protein n=1 Tax=Flavisolibacter tropicus TaxID=1492898 RepID=A0A172TZB8_9BACT|nr:hypothetical protein [Flavisolibacter tropicus]ANE52449.1 hypothetical protein SY85_20155 [Flavisolibacter tropicus]
MTNLVVQSFGRESEYKRAILTILSFYAYTSESIENTQVLLFSDKPDYFSTYLAGLPVKHVILTPEKIKNMRGNIDFLHRMKIALIDESFQFTDGNLLYADSDTFFINDPTPFVQQVNEDKSFMHLHEYEFESLRNMALPAGKTFRAFLELIESQSIFLADGNQVTITAKHSSWNAGVMIFHRSHVKFIPDVYTITDQFYPLTHNHASEQYAFSIVLQEKTNLKPCDSMIYHYWHRIKKSIVDEFLDIRLSVEWAELSFSSKLEQVKQWTELLPVLFTNHVLTLKDNSVQALNENNFPTGYKWAFKAFKKGAINDKQFIRDVLYHAKRQLIKK